MEKIHWFWKKPVVILLTILHAVHTITPCMKKEMDVRMFLINYWLVDTGKVGKEWSTYQVTYIYVVLTKKPEFMIQS